ncbi:unnamed protein product [Brassica rapa]|uniref:DUF1985 domain-containing protein n=1 Tax=Brassica campestris TaxID=3711 RepID=A0A3P5YUQ9_BRACM|nr:unnamed protein product [Brassica rapa]VDC71477.1 unnamed protein product [Brassica rapa]
MENFSWKLTSFVVPSFMCPAIEVLILINRVETVDPTNFINYSSTFKSLKAVKDVVSVEVWEYVEKSPLGIIIKQLYCKKRHELWFLIEKQLARFSIFEFQDITGLNCEPLPNTMVVEDVEKSNSFWALFNLRCTRSTPSAEDICTLCQSPDVCRSWSREDQIRLCYLAILTGGLLALDRREAIPSAKTKLLMDLEIFEQYPWGRVAFIELVQQIKDATAKKIKENSSYVCKGFVQVTCMYQQSLDEVHPVWEDQDEDPEIDNFMEFLRQDNSLSTITWQALPEYPLTPIECNKRSLVASQRKSKKAKISKEGGKQRASEHSRYR